MWWWHWLRFCGTNFDGSILRLTRRSTLTNNSFFLFNFLLLIFIVLSFYYFSYKLLSLAFIWVFFPYYCRLVLLCSRLHSLCFSIFLQQKMATIAEKIRKCENAKQHCNNFKHSLHIFDCFPLADVVYVAQRIMCAALQMAVLHIGKSITNSSKIVNLSSICELFKLHLKHCNLGKRVLCWNKEVPRLIGVA